MLNRLFVLWILSAVLMCAGGMAVGATFIGIDDVTNSNWRTNASLAPDGTYGSDGYVLYGLLEVDGKNVTSYNATSVYADSRNLVDLPGYITDISTTNSRMWSGNGNFGQIEDPSNGNALTNTPTLGNTSYNATFTISGQPGQPYQLVIIIADGDNQKCTKVVTVTDAGGAVAAPSYKFSVSQYVAYWVYDVESTDAGTVTVNVVTSGGNNSLVGFAFDGRGIADNPFPASGATGVPLDVTLSWITGEDPNNPGNPNPAIIEHKVYFGSDPNMANNPLVATIAAADPAEYTPPSPLQRDTTYYWRVDEITADADTFSGARWYFETILSVPSIETQPVRTLVEPGTSAVLTVTATNPFTGDSTGMDYQWMKYVDGVNDAPVGTNSSSLTIDPVDDNSEGHYYCIVTITSNSASTVSEIVLVGQRSAIGHWPLDGNADDVSGNGWNQINDSGNTWVQGVTEEAGDMAADFMAMEPNDIINVGNVPVNITGEVTISLWARPRNVSANWTGMLSKQFDSSTRSFWLGQHSTNGQVNFSTFLPSETRTLAPNSLVDNTWTHILCTYDGADQKTYINGILADSIAVNTDLLDPDGDLIIGGIIPGAVANYFNGSIDDVAIYNYAMTAQEVADFYVAKMGGLCVEVPAFDFDGDCRVGLGDLSLFIADWLDCQIYPECVSTLPDSE